MRNHEMQYNRLRSSRSHSFTWIGYERVDNRKGMISAMVPRRIPKTCIEEIKDRDGNSVKTERLESFHLEHYAMMLASFEMEEDEKVLKIMDVAPENDYNQYLPLDRMGPF